jgi:2-polyprenyl-3-methyl-5-hydroxy-6-metoxy-1,4-benzoquinol methylase
MRRIKSWEDTFGQEMWAYYKGEEASEIVERDDGYFNASPKGPAIYFSEYKDWDPLDRKAMKLVKGRVLDIGCGAGRHSLYLQKMGHNVLGIDSSPLAIKICEERGLKRARVMSIEELNFKPNSFDTIIMLGSNFGLLGSFKKAKRLLKKLYKMTSEGGLIVASTRDTYKTDNPDHLAYHKFNKKKGRMAGQLRLRIRFRKCVGRWFDYLIVSKKEMEEILKGTGWKIQGILDSSNSAYIAVIEKEPKILTKTTEKQESQ